MPTIHETDQYTQRYHNTLMYDDSEDSYVLVQGVSGDSASVEEVTVMPLVVRNNPKDGYKFGLSYTTEPDNLVPYFPEVGYYNLDGATVLLCRTGNRQWSWSYNSEMYLGHSLSGYKTRISQEDVEKLPCILFPKYPVFNKSVLKSNVALSKELAMKDSTLYYNGFPVGEVKDEQIALKESLPTHILEYIQKIIPEEGLVYGT